MNPALQLTYARILLTFLFMWCLFSPGAGWKWAALAVFLVASLTDYYDGWLARRLDCVTELGKLLDPIADKVLTLAAFLAFIELNLVPAWMVVLVVTRELLITGLRLQAASQGVVLSAAGAGKQKTVSQIVTALAGLLYLALRELPAVQAWRSQLDDWGQTGMWWLMVMTVVLTLSSGMSVLRHGYREIALHAGRR